MSTAPPAYPKLAEEPKQDEPEIDTPEGEGLLSQDRPYPPSAILVPSIYIPLAYRNHSN